MNQIRVVIVDDHRCFTEMLGYFLSERGDGIRLVGAAGEVSSGLQLVGELKPDVVLMDLRMPGEDGIGGTRRIRKGYPGTKVILLTGSRSEQHLQEAIEAGAHGYVVKDKDIASLSSAIRAVHCGEMVFPTELLSSAWARQGGARRHHEDDRRLLKLLAQGFNNHELANALAMSESSVKRRLHRIRTNLNVTTRGELVAHAARNEAV